MKKLMNLFCTITMLVSVGMLLGCHDKDEDPELSVSESEIIMESQGGTQEVLVKSNCKWIVSGGANWCKVTPKEGNGTAVIEVEVDESTDQDERKCTLRVRTVDGSIVEEVYVKQKSIDILSAAGPIKFAYDRNDKKVLQITSNVDWEITGIPDWLDCSQRSGKGNRDVELKTLSENNSATPRTGTLVIKSKTLNAAVEVEQAPKLSSCSVEPKGLIALYDGFAYLPEVSGNVKRFKAGWIRADYYNSMSEAEVLEFARKGVAITNFNELLSMHGGMAPNTSYYLITLAYDMNDNEGRVVRTEFKTRPTGDNQAWVEIGNLYRNSNDQVWWTASPDGSTDKYYTIYVCGMTDEQIVDVMYMDEKENVYVDDAKLAWLINNEVSKQSGVYKVKKGEAEIVEEKGYCIENNRIVARGKSLQLGWALFATWGVNVFDNNLSGFLRTKIAYVSLDDSGKKVVDTNKTYKSLKVKQKH